MKVIRIYYIILLTALTASSCQTDIQFNGRITAPLVVVNSFITPDSAITAQISESQFFLSNQSTFNLIDNATISLFVNGTEKEKMVHTNNGEYVSTYHPVIGDSIRYLVRTPGMGNVSCTTNVEPQAVVLSLDTTAILTGTNTPILNYQTTSKGGIPGIDTIGHIIGQRVKFVLNFSDDATTQNFYRLVVITKTTSQYETMTDYSFSFDDLVSGNTNKNTIGFSTSFSSNSYNVFTDDLFNGKQYPLTFSITRDKYVYLPGYEQPHPQVEVSINLQSISKGYYYYLKSRDIVGGSSFFSEPVQIYNNIVGGIGILGSYTSHITKIEL